ncbi:hypothetical protein [Tautonia plasticadhaerens]|uniref:Uncharacterized protein n=1 Tax=Tautonia plasticadhaerens TaxID=2527974 RepID=A0A518H2B2_9BACT|nr:hypothetical protein [Tautonia plasticadhaerens]QDV34950.1 hypothetical protein ElP_28470 [Tautonia plasticadhaerens]
MSELADIALAFAKEVMGWENCREATLYQDAVCGHNPACNEGQIFSYGKLDSVMAAVREWCDDAEQGLTIAYYAGLPNAPWRVVIPWEAEVMHDNLCQALMAACLEAKRKL